MADQVLEGVSFRHLRPRSLADMQRGMRVLRQTTAARGYMDDVGKPAALLPLRCTPEADESLTGYILRLALRNHQSTPGPLAAAVGIRHLPVLFPTAGQIAELAAKSGVLPEILARMAAERIPVITAKKRSRLHGVAFPRNWLTTQRRACPQCLEDSPHHRTVWDIVHLRACGTHSCDLIASCQDCGKRLGWGNADLRRCSCGVDISRRKSSPCDPRAARWVRSGFLADGSPPPRLLAEAPFVTAVTAFTLIEAAFLSCLPQDLIAPSVHRSAESQAFAFDALDDDPDHLRRTIEHLEGRSGGLPFRMVMNAVSQLERLCTPTRGLEAIDAMLIKHLGIPTLIT